jgi:hypothetical protein
MDKLERYLDQVCRTIGGPRSLRQHVRQELREHLLDAVAEHRRGRLSESEALDRALADFGGPEQVRSELEATHGHRVMAVVIDKAMQWKEKTMRAKWLWTTWAHLAVIGVVVLNVLFFVFIQTMCVPKLRKIQSDGWLNLDSAGLPLLDFLDSSLRWLDWFGQHATWCLLAALGLWGLFEWRVRGENKSFIRLSVFGTAAVLLTIGSIIITSALIIPFELGMPSMAQMSARMAIERMTEIDTSIEAIENALKTKDWDAMEQPVTRANLALAGLDHVAEAIAARAGGRDKLTADEIHRRLAAVRRGLADVQDDIHAKDAPKVESALKILRDVYGTLRTGVEPRK